MPFLIIVRMLPSQRAEAREQPLNDRRQPLPSDRRDIYSIIFIKKYQLRVMAMCRHSREKGSKAVQPSGCMGLLGNLHSSDVAWSRLSEASRCQKANVCSTQDVCSCQKGTSLPPKFILFPLENQLPLASRTRLPLMHLCIILRSIFSSHHPLIKNTSVLPFLMKQLLHFLNVPLYGLSRFWV